MALKEAKALLDSKQQPETCSAGDANSLHQQITAQGDKIRKLKGEKAVKDVVTSEVNILLNLKAEFKKVTGQDWSPQVQIPKSAVENKPVDNKDTEALNQKIVAQGNKVRQLKGEKAGKEVINKEVQALLELKKEFKAVTGNEWKPQEVTTANVKTSVPETQGAAELLTAKVSQQGDLVRQLKTSGSPKVGQHNA